MPIVDPFETPSGSSRGIVDPFEAPPDDHGLARRQAMSPLGKALSPITEYPRNYAEMRKEAEAAIASGISDIAGHGSLTDPQGTGLYDIGKGALKTAGGAIGYTFSPISAAYRSIIGQPLEDVTGIPREQTEFAAQLATPGLGLAGAAKEAPLVGVETRLPPRPPAVPLPRGLENPALQNPSVMLSKLPFVGTPMGEAVHAIPGQVGQKVEEIAGQYAPEMPKNVVGGGIQRTLRTAAEQERAAAEAQQAAHIQAINQRQEQADILAQRAFGTVEPNQMAENSIKAVQESHARGQAADRANWEDVNNLNAQHDKKAFNGLNGRMEEGLDTEGVTLDPKNTPNAIKMMGEMKRLSGEAPSGDITGIPPRMMAALEKEYGAGQVPADVLEQLVPGSTAGVVPGKNPQFRLMGKFAPEAGSDTVPVQGLNELRKRIGKMAYDAEKPEDIRASNAIKNQFGDFLNDTMENHLVSGDPNARTVIQNAVNQHRAFKERFGYNAANLRGEDQTAARTLNLMATGDIGPEAIAKKLVGAGGKPGTQLTAAPLHDAIMGAVENPAAVRADLRGAYFNAMTAGKTPRAIRSNIEELGTTRMGKNLFSPEEHTILRGYAGFGEQTPVAREAAEAKIPAGKAEQLYKRMSGSTSSAEDTFNELDSAMKGGDIKNAARTWGRMTPADRNQFRGAWLRNLGGGGEEFSLNKFVTNWNKYSDQAKTFMLGRDHRDAIGEFYDTAKTYKDAIAKYGNPSGTGLQTFWQHLMGAVVKGTGVILAGHIPGELTAGALATGLGMRGLAMFLATPKGAEQVARWTRLAKAYEKAPSTRTFYLLSQATRGLANENRAQ